MFCIKRDVITLESIEIYSFVTAWTSINDEPYWVILLMYESHEMRHIGFPQIDGVRPEKIRNFSRSWMMKQTSPLESSREI